MHEEQLPLGWLRRSCYRPAADALLTRCVWEESSSGLHVPAEVPSALHCRAV
jgi:hypothetical protein